MIGKRGLKCFTGTGGESRSALFKRVVESRRSARAFERFENAEDRKKVESAAKEALELSLLSPSGFNLQPYRAVLVQDDLVRKQLANAMVGGNIARVMQAPLTIVWLADLKPWKLLEDLVALERTEGTMSELELSNLVSDAEFLLGGLGGFGSAGETGGGVLSGMVQRRLGTQGIIENVSLAMERATKKAIMSAISQVTQAPTINDSAEAWGFKNTMLAAQTYMLAMNALGYDTCPMEGFDARRVLQVVSAPSDRYSVPIVVSSGVAVKIEARPRTRFAFDKVFARDSIDFPLYKDNDEE